MKSLYDWKLTIEKVQIKNVPHPLFLLFLSMANHLSDFSRTFRDYLEKGIFKISIWIVQTSETLLAIAETISFDCF